MSNMVDVSKVPAKVSIENNLSEAISVVLFSSNTSMELGVGASLVVMVESSNALLYYVGLGTELGLTITHQYQPDVRNGYLGSFGSSESTTGGDLPTTAVMGDMYLCDTEGYESVVAGKTFGLGDGALYDITDTWQQFDNTDNIISVNGKVGLVVLNKADVGLGNVDNTSDVDKPISSATKTYVDDGLLLKMGLVKDSNVYANIVDMVADYEAQEEGQFLQAETTFYKYKGSGTGVIGDYISLSTGGAYGEFLSLLTDPENLVLRVDVPVSGILPLLLEDDEDLNFDVYSNDYENKESFTNTGVEGTGLELDFGSGGNRLLVIKNNGSARLPRLKTGNGIGAYTGATYITEVLNYYQSDVTIGEYEFSYTSITSFSSNQENLIVSDNAFKNCSSLVKFDPSTQSVSTHSFDGCTKLKEITFDISTEITIGAEAFRNCTNLKKIRRLGSSTNVIGTDAFYGVSAFVDTESSTFIADATAKGLTLLTSAAKDVTYDNTDSGMTATNVKGAIDELSSEKADRTVVIYDDMDAMIADRLVLPQIAGQEYKVGTAGAYKFYNYNGGTSGTDADYDIKGASAELIEAVATNTSDIATNAEAITGIKEKTDYFTVTEPIDLDTLKSDVAGNKEKADLITVTEPIDLDSLGGITLNAVDSFIEIELPPTLSYPYDFVLNFVGSGSLPPSGYAYNSKILWAGGEVDVVGTPTEIPSATLAFASAGTYLIQMKSNNSAYGSVPPIKAVTPNDLYNYMTKFWEGKYSNYSSSGNWSYSQIDGALLLKEAYFNYTTRTSRTGFWVKNCPKLQIVHMPEIIEMGDNSNLSYTFLNSPNLSDLFIPNCTEIGYGAFQDCKSLVNVSLSKAVNVSIGYDAFKNCISLESVTGLSASAYRGAFNGCEALQYSVVSVADDEGVGSGINVRPFGTTKAIAVADWTLDVGSGKYYAEFTSAYVYEEDATTKRQKDCIIASVALADEEIAKTAGLYSQIDITYGTPATIKIWSKAIPSDSITLNYNIMNGRYFPKSMLMISAKDPEIDTKQDIIVQRTIYGTAYSTEPAYATLTHTSANNGTVTVTAPNATETLLFRNFYVMPADSTIQAGTVYGFSAFLNRDGADNRPTTIKYGICKFTGDPTVEADRNNATLYSNIANGSDVFEIKGGLKINGTVIAGTEVELTTGDIVCSRLLVTSTATPNEDITLTISDTYKLILTRTETGADLSDSNIVNTSTADGATQLDVNNNFKNSIDNSVQTSGNQIIADVKTFTSSPIVPTPTTDYQASTKKYVDEVAIENKVVKDLAIKLNAKVPFTEKFEAKTWTGLTNFSGYRTWTDGTNIYYSSATTQYVLDVATSTWSAKTWTGLTSFYGSNIWTDGTDIYYSLGTNQYVLDVATSTWSAKTWTGLTDFYGERIWTDGTNIYYSYETTQYILDVATSTWSAKTWTGLTDFYGSRIWTEGTNIYYSEGTDQYSFIPKKKI